MDSQVKNSPVFKVFVLLGKKRWYDFWVSVKFAGPDYVPGSKKTNGVYVNRMVMRRTPKEQAR